MAVASRPSVAAATSVTTYAPAPRSSATVAPVSASAVTPHASSPNAQLHVSASGADLSSGS